MRNRGTEQLHPIRSVRRQLTTAAVMLVVPLAGCAAQPTSTGAASGTAAAAVSSDPVEGVTSGSYTGTFGEKQATIQAAYLIDGKDVTIDAGNYATATADQAVFLVVNGGHLKITGSTITKSGDATQASQQNPGDVSDDYNFYGLNSAVVVAGEGSTVTIADSAIVTTSSGSNAVLPTLAGAASVTETEITTSGNSSRGLHVTYGGSATGSGLTITTAGAHSAALATDRGSGTVTVTGENALNTSGDGSPLIYSTGTIDASGVTGSASGAQAVVVEGKNHATLTDSEVTTNGNDAVMLYQSFSGDAADADAKTTASTFVLKNSTLTYTGTGPVLYFTNTNAEVTLEKSAFVAESASALVSAAEDRWGTSGSNGATATITAVGSKLSGKVTAGDSSKVTLKLTESSKLTGAVSGSAKVTTDVTSSHKG